MPEPVWLSHYRDILFDSMRMDDRPLNAGSVKVVVGSFFEVLGSMILKAEFSDRPGNWEVYPDLIKWACNGNNSDLLIEVKGASRKNGFVFDCGQVREYEELTKVDFPFTNARVRYLLFVHVLGKAKDPLKDRFKNVNELIVGLCGGTVCGLYVPLDVMQNIERESYIHSYTKSYTRQGKGDRNSYFKLSAVQVQKWVRYPLTFKKDMEDSGYGMNGYKPNWFFIDGFKVLGHEVREFPFFELKEGERK